MGMEETKSWKTEHSVDTAKAGEPEWSSERLLGVERVREYLEQGEAMVIGAGSGLSTAAGLTYGGKRFEKHFHEFIVKYGMKDMYSAGFYPFATQEEKWAYWSRHIYYNRYGRTGIGVYRDLYEMVKNRNYFVLTTNVDHQFWLSGFADERIFAVQGDYGLFQCKNACHKTLYNNETQVRAMMEQQRECRIPSGLVPRCPVCGGDMEVHLRCDGNFVEDQAWDQAAERYMSFLEQNREKRIVFLELGVGMNTPGIIKYSFWQMTKERKKAVYICVNKGQAWAPKEIEDRSVVLDTDIGIMLKELRRYMSETRPERKEKP